MTDLKPDLKLHRAPNVRVDIDSSNNIQVRTDESIFYLGPHGLALLDVFYQPVSVSEAVERLGPMASGPQDWISLTTTMVQLYEAGVLRDESNHKPKLETGHSFGAAAIHVGMLNDRGRTDSFLKGIPEVVKPGDVVVDIGTGTGVLAMAAARAGAKHVYAVEASVIGEFAQRIFEANGLADRITLVSGWSTKIDLPEKADVLITETIGNEPLGENVMEIVSDAKKRLLKPGARLIPGKVRILGLPVSIPERELSKRFPTGKNLENWRQWYGMDFAPLSEAAEDPDSALFVKPQKARDWEVLGEEIMLAEVDLAEVEHLTIDNSAAFTTTAAGRFDGLMVYFELELGPDTTLSTHPASSDDECSWRNMVWRLDPGPVAAGDRFQVNYQYRATGTWHKVTVEPD